MSPARIAPLPLLVAVLLSPGLAAADRRGDHSELPDATTPVEDAVLYSCNRRDGSVPIAVTFKPETELRDLVTWVMGFTCKNFTFDPRIVSTGRKVTVIVPNKMTAVEAYRVFLGALATVGLTVVPDGNMMLVVEAATAKRASVPLYKSGVPDGGEQVVRYVLRPQYAQGDTLLTAFTALKSDIGDVQLVGSLLLMTDYASHIRDMMAIAKLVDVAGGSDGIYTIPVVHADATKLATEIGGMLGIATAAGGRAPAPVVKGAPGAAATSEADQRAAAAVPSKLLVDERTNSLVMAASPAGYARVKALVDRLDIALDIDGGASIHVLRLSSAVAEDLAKTLNDTIQGAKKPGPTTAGAAGPPVSVADPASGSVALEGQVHVTSDKLTNSVIVMSSGRDFLAIREVVRQLDQPRRQVYIETEILEIDMTKDLEAGASSSGALPTGNGTSFAVGGVQTGTLSTVTTTSIATSLATATGLVGALVGSPISASTSLLGQSIPSYAVLFQALMTNGNSNTKKTPSFIGLDNQKIHWSSGIDVPYKKGVLPSLAGTTTATALTTNIDREKLELVLDITPHISTDDNVLLEIKHSSKDLGPDQADLGPTWTTQEFESSLVVHDQQTVVLEGLVQERDSVTQTKVPVLGDIPLVGYLFKYSSKIKKKSNLLIVLTPYIIKDQSDIRAITERKMREHDDFIRSVATLDHMTYVPHMNYKRKRGLVEEINRAVTSVEEDTAARNAIVHARPMESGPLQYGPPPEEGASEAR